MPFPPFPCLGHRILDFITQIIFCKKYQLSYEAPNCVFFSFFLFILFAEDYQRSSRICFQTRSIYLILEALTEVIGTIRLPKCDAV
jgi:hypothetical protein